MEESARLKAELEEKIFTDYENDMLSSRDEGIAQGIEKGIEQGRQEGRQEGIEKGSVEKAIEVARNMKKLELDVNTISQVTGLSTEQIDSL
jgi:predicted transposase/invertase (TIGR01784 family)